MLRTTFLAILIAIAAAFLPGCGKKNSEKVIGVWRTTEKRGHDYAYLEIAKNAVSVDGKSFSVILRDENGKVAVVRTDNDETLWLISVVDEDRLTIDTPDTGESFRLVRTTPEEMTAAMNPPVDRIIGVWRSEKETFGPGIYPVLEVTVDRVRLDGQIIADRIESRGGAYFAQSAQGVDLGSMLLVEEGRLRTDLVPGLGDFVASSHDEANTLRRAKRAFMARYFGFWREASPVVANRPLRYIELREDNIDDNGAKAAVGMYLVPDGLSIVAGEGRGEPTIATLLDNGRLLVKKGLFGAGTEYERSTPEDLDRINNPKLEDYVGFWLLTDAAGGGFRAVEIGPDYLVRDRRKEPMFVGARGVNALVLTRPRPTEIPMAVLSRDGDDGIRLFYGEHEKIAYPYRRATAEEYQAVASTIVNPLSVIIGFWKSERPVEDSMGQSSVHATSAFAVGVRGSGGQAVDWCSISFVSPNLRNRSIDWQDTVREGVFVFQGGQADGPVLLERIDGNRGSWVQIRVINTNTIEVAEDNRTFVRMVRTDRDELLRLRSSIRQ